MLSSYDVVQSYRKPWSAMTVIRAQKRLALRAA